MIHGGCNRINTSKPVRDVKLDDQLYPWSTLPSSAHTSLQYLFAAKFILENPNIRSLWFFFSTAPFTGVIKFK